VTLFNIDQKAEQLTACEQQMNAPDFWDNPDAAQKVVAELKTYKSMVDPVRNMTDQFDDMKVLYELAKEEGDAEAMDEADQALGELEERMVSLETRALLAGKNDHRNCYVSIYAGDGGTEANDWAEILLRMYLHYFDKQGCPSKRSTATTASRRASAM